MNRSRRATTSLVLLGLSTAVLPRVARGQEQAEEGALAEMLYRQGRALVAEGKAAEACPKFAESYRLDATTGTLLNLASCHEIGSRASRRLAQRFEVRVDGVPVRSAARGVSTPVDPGHHTIEATAPQRKPWSQDVSVAEGTTNVAVSVPELERVAPDALPRPDSVALASPARPIPTSVYVAGGVTLALTAAAATTALIYMDHRSRDGAEQREPELGQNRRLGAINLALDVGAVVGAGATLYLYWTRPSEATRAARASVAPWVRPGAAGVAVEGAF